MSIDLIRARQKDLAEQRVAALRLIEERQAKAAKLFADTGIPAMWDAIKHIEVPHWRGNGSRDKDIETLVPLVEHLKHSSDLSLALLDHDGATKIHWYAEATDKGAVWLRVGGREGRQGDSYTVEGLRDYFVDYMAKLLPPLKDTNSKAE